jgi:ubiquinone/menaquinone biosynthesis C-methylase UbiE
VLTPWVPRRSTLLDIGAGSGLLAQALVDELHVRATLADVVNNSRTTLPFVLCDGGRLPFRDHAFEVALLAFVLHHAPDPMRVLWEGRRVSRRLIVFEDTFRSTVERVFAAWTDWVLNRGHGISPAWGRLPPQGWLDLIGGVGQPVHVEEMRPKWLGTYRDPIRHLLVVMDS